MPAKQSFPATALDRLAEIRRGLLEETTSPLVADPGQAALLEPYLVMLCDVCRALDLTDAQIVHVLGAGAIALLRSCGFEALSTPAPYPVLHLPAQPDPDYIDLPGGQCIPVLGEIDSATGRIVFTPFGQAVQHLRSVEA